MMCVVNALSVPKKGRIVERSKAGLARYSYAPALVALVLTTGTSLAEEQMFVKNRSHQPGSVPVSDSANCDGKPTLRQGAIFDNGNVGIGTTNPGHKLTVSGSFWADIAYVSNATVSGTTTCSFTKANNNMGVGETNPDVRMVISGTCKATKFTETSDEHLKTDAQPLAHALQSLRGLSGVSFALIHDPESGQPGKRELGFLAQDVEEVLPEVVRTDASGEKAIAYTRILPVLIQAIREQQDQIDRLRALIESKNGR